MTHRVLAACLITVLGMAGAARADVLRTARGQPLREVSHTVDITISGGVASYRVRRVFANPGQVADEAGLELDLPFGAAATGLRIRARDRWYDAELMERDKAAALYKELTGIGAYVPKDPALLQWMWADKLYLQVFPVLPGQPSTVEYTLTVPTHYQRGQLHLSYPRPAQATGDAAAGRPLAPPVITVQPSWGDATTRVVIDGLRTAPGAPVVLGAVVEPPTAANQGGSPEASYVASALEVPDTPAARAPVATATVTVAIDHTYRSDLRVDLITPAGARVVVHDGSGGDANDLRGSFPVTLPAGTRAAGRWLLVVSDHAARDVGTLDAWSIALGPVRAAASDVPLFVPDAPESPDEAGVAPIEVAPPPIDVIAARLGTVVASDRHGFARLELDVAPRLRPLPAQARVVFAVDASHSMGDDGIARQLELVLAYLAHVPDARAEVVLYRRRATRLFGGFVPARDVAARLAGARRRGLLAPGNGSALDEGARVAAAALAGQRGPLRVVVTTDERLRSRFELAQALRPLATLPADAVVHVVVPEGDAEAVSLARDDGSALAPLATAHHGIAARVTGLADLERARKDLTARALGLVRPIQLDRVAVTGLDLDEPLAGDADDVLPEGHGLRAMQGVSRPPAEVTVTGLLWSDPYRQVVKVDPTFARATAAWVFSEDEHGELDEAEQMKVAMLGRAVSPVTSYLAVEPGVRPSTAGLAAGERLGAVGLGSYGAGAGGGGAFRERPRDLDGLVAAAARACITRHAPRPGWRVELAVETTWTEIVDVEVKAGAGQPVAACLAEAVWSTRLTDAWSREREAFTLVYDRAP